MWTRRWALMHSQSSHTCARTKPSHSVPRSTQRGADIDELDSDWSQTNLTRVTVHVHRSTNLTLALSDCATTRLWASLLFQVMAPDQQQNARVERTYVQLPPALQRPHSLCSCSLKLLAVSHTSLGPCVSATVQESVPKYDSLTFVSH